MKTDLGIWEITVLSLLRESPMHPYQMQRLLRDRHKDEILVLKRGSLYHAIGRLVRAELIRAKDVTRNGRRPERTTYAITAAGRREFISALRGIIAIPHRESSEFMAAMSFLVHLTPAEATPRLEERCLRLEKQIAEYNGVLETVSERVARINLVESEYLVAMLEAELAWIRGLINEINSSKLTWDLKTILKEASVGASSAGLLEDR